MFHKYNQPRREKWIKNVFIHRMDLFLLLYRMKLCLCRKMNATQDNPVKKIKLVSKKTNSTYFLSHEVPGFNVGRRNNLQVYDMEVEVKSSGN